MEIKQIEKKSLVDEVYSQIRDHIRSGDWKEGDRIASEHRLSADFNVSRAVIREALQYLRAQHLIVTRQGSGSYVSNPNNFADGSQRILLSENSFSDVMELRYCLEFKAIELAVKRAGAADFERIAAMLKAMEAAIGNTALFSRADYAFHYAVVQSAGNPLLLRAMDSCESSIRCCLYEMNKLHDSHDWGLALHQEELNKIMEHDAKGAICVLKKNRGYNHARLMEYFSD